jgi:hypothetical protein
LIYAVNGHTAAALNRDTHTTYLGEILGFWVTCGVKRCNCILVEADRHLKPLPVSIVDIYKVFEHIDMLFMGMGIWEQP